MSDFLRVMVGLCYRRIYVCVAVFIWTMWGEEAWHKIIYSIEKRFRKDSKKVSTQVNGFLLSELYKR